MASRQGLLFRVFLCGTSFLTPIFRGRRLPYRRRRCGNLRGRLCAQIHYQDMIETPGKNAIQAPWKTFAGVVGSAGISHTRTRACAQQQPTWNLSAEHRMICTTGSCGNRTFLWSYACTASAVQQEQQRSRSPAVFFRGFRHKYALFKRGFSCLEAYVFFRFSFAEGTYNCRRCGRPSPDEFEYVEQQQQTAKQQPDMCRACDLACVR